MALQPKIIACGKSVGTFSMAVRFLTGPAVIAATSIAVGLRGVLLHVAIVQVRQLNLSNHPHISKILHYVWMKKFKITKEFSCLVSLKEQWN